MQELLSGLPAYQGGKMSEKIYNAGQGLHARINDEQPLRLPTKRDKAAFLYELNCTIPFGLKVENRTEDGEHLTMDVAYEQDRYHVEKTEHEIFVTTLTHRPMDKPTMERLVTETTREAFLAYLETLKALGYEIIWQNVIDNNVYFELTGHGRLLYAYFYGNSGQARFIDDTVSERIDTFGSATPASPVKTEICQFSLHYDLDICKRGVAINCGMLYIVRLPDRSLFLVDGGEYEQATEEALPEVLRVMREMSGVKDGEKIPVAAWFCTHAHDDHMDVFTKFLRLYHDQMDLQRVIFNFAAYQRFALMAQVFPMLDRLTRYYPDVRYLKPHSGQTFNLGGVKFEVLQTHEDVLVVPGADEIRDFNESTTVLKLSFEGVSFMLLGDINRHSADMLLAHYSPETLHATLVQVAHHLHNNLPELYTVMKPDIAVVPQGVKGREIMADRYESLLKGVSADKVYFDEEESLFFVEKNGTIILARTCPQVGGAYDGSAI